MGRSTDRARDVECARNTTELNSDNGAVFFMNPDSPEAPTHIAVVAQLTVVTGEDADVYAALSLQGRSKTGVDWYAESVVFSNDHVQECEEALASICLDEKTVSEHACLACCEEHEFEIKQANCSAADLTTFCNSTL